MKDSGICPYCEKQFDITSDMYGEGKECPLCKERIDIFADPEYYVETPFGMLPIGTIKKETLAGRLLAALILRVQKRKEHLDNLNKGLGK